MTLGTKYQKKKNTLAYLGIMPQSLSVFFAASRKGTPKTCDAASAASASSSGLDFPPHKPRKEREREIIPPKVAGSPFLPRSEILKNRPLELSSLAQLNECVPEVEICRKIPYLFLFNQRKWGGLVA